MHAKSTHGSTKMWWCCRPIDSRENCFALCDINITCMWVQVTLRLWWPHRFIWKVLNCISVSSVWNSTLFPTQSVLTDAIERARFLISNAFKGSDKSREDRRSLSEYTFPCFCRLYKGSGRLLRSVLRRGTLSGSSSCKFACISQRVVKVEPTKFN